MSNKAGRGSRGALIYVNFAIIAVAAALYAALVSPFSVMGITLKGSVPVYKAADRGEVTLLCAASWDAGALPGILDLLKEKGVKITFAVGGELLSTDPDIVRRMAEEGHDIAVMGMEPENDGGGRFIEEDVSKALDAAEAVLGVRPKLYYCGERDPAASARACRRLSVTTLCCTADIGRAEHPGEALAEALSKSAPGGSIIAFMPTGNAGAELGSIIEKLKNMGLSIVPVHKMLYN